jgi:hypothetical protein
VTPTGRAILAALHADGPTLVCTLAARLDAPVKILEAFLYALKAHGLVTCAFEGSPPVLTWRESPACSVPGAHAPAISNPQHEGAAP